MLDHIDHLVKVGGINCVALGSDYGGPRLLGIQGLADCDGWPMITYHLLRRGYKEEEIKKILGGNLARLLKTVYSNKQNQ